MPLPVTFAGLPEGDNPASLLDTQFAAVAGFTVIPCAATGQNVIQLEPFFDAPTVNQYSDLSPVFTFVATETCTGNVTLNVSGLGEHPAYKANGGALIEGGDIQAGLVYQAQFLTALDGGAGGFVVNVGGGGGGGVSPGGPDVANVIMNAYTGSGVFTPGPNLIAAVVEGMGGGGGGGPGNAGTGLVLCGGGGGSGGYFKAYLTPAQVGPSQTITIGIGGAPSVAGTATAFGSLCTAGGGAGGHLNDRTSDFGQGGDGGSASLATGVVGIAIRGGAGTWGGADQSFPPPGNVYGGVGGQVMGGAAVGVAIFAAGPIGGGDGSPNSGAGGGGGCSANADGSGHGGNGANGWMLVTSFYSA